MNLFYTNITGGKLITEILSSMNLAIIFPGGIPHSFQLFSTDFSWRLLRV